MTGMMQAPQQDPAQAMMLYALMGQGGMDQADMMQMLM